MSEPVVTTIQLASKCCMVCEFYYLEGGMCRRNPPQVLVTRTEKGAAKEWTSVFPPMKPNGVCGEFKARTP